ncbi:MAG: Ig-like domain-containing protein [Gallionella sp.]|nr:Ig-like domain-containing protein [Gallionella sp.]
MNKFESITKPLKWFMALLLAAFVAGCSGGSDPILGGSAVGAAAPTVSSTVPANLATGVQINRRITATFSEPTMNTATITTASFKVTGPLVTAVPGAVTYAGSTAVFTPTAALAANSLYTATITTVVKNQAGIAMAADRVWSFTTGPAADTIAPTLISTGANHLQEGLLVNRDLTATFSEAMDPATLVSPSPSTSAATNFVVCSAGIGASPAATCGPSVAGVVTYLGNTATFNPDSNLAFDTWYTAEIKGGATGAKDLAVPGLALVAGARTNPWSFKTGATPDTAAPTVTLTSPANLAIDVIVSKQPFATFSEDMKSATMITTNFTMKETVSGNNVPGTVAYDVMNKIATFSPLASLSPDTDYTVTVGNGAQDLAGNALVVPAVGGLPKPNPWTFRTLALPVILPAVDLGLAAPFGIAATAGVTNTPLVPITVINGDVALDPVAGAQCNFVAVDAAGGFGLCGGSPPTINGTVISPLFPDAGITSGAIKADLLAAFLSITPPAGPPAAGSLGGATNLPAGTTLGEPTGAALVQGDNLFAPGVYQSLTSIMITGDITLDAGGDPNADFIFQSNSTIGTAAGAASPGVHTRILLINGAKASNVWWQAGSSATLGTNTEFQGNILASASITMETGATSCGRLLAGAFTAGAFVFDSNVVSVPGHASAPVSCQ